MISKIVGAVILGALMSGCATTAPDSAKTGEKTGSDTTKQQPSGEKSSGGFKY